MADLKQPELPDAKDPHIHDGMNDNIESERPRSASSTSDNTKNENSTTEDLTRGIGNLARELSRTSTTVDAELGALCPQPGSRLDPNSPSFDPYSWAKAMIRLSESDPESAPWRTLGVAFRNLDVYGWTTGAEYQKGVLDLPVDIVSWLVKLIGGNKQQRRVEILRNFEGVVEEGELLLVLGPPGSGCSTLLKTIAGETRGLDVSSDSYLNFRGLPDPLSSPQLD